MEMIFHSHANKTHLKVRVLELGSGLLLFGIKFAQYFNRAFSLCYGILIITCFPFWMFYAMNCYGSIEIKFWFKTTKYPKRCGNLKETPSRSLLPCPIGIKKYFSYSYTSCNGGNKILNTYST